MYKVKFVTNLDCPIGIWHFPESVVAIPQIGHFVESYQGKILKVLTITHKEKKDSTKEPYLEIYLGNI